MAGVGIWMFSIYNEKRRLHINKIDIQYYAAQPMVSPNPVVVEVEVVVLVVVVVVVVVVIWSSSYGVQGIYHSSTCNTGSELHVQIDESVFCSSCPFTNWRGWEAVYLGCERIVPCGPPILETWCRETTECLKVRNITF